MKLPAPKSHAEETLALQLRADKVRGWVREFEFAKDIGRKWRFDFVFHQRKLAIELDGGNRMAKIIKGKAVAVGRHTGEKDAEKLNRAALMGWKVLRFTPRQVKRGEAIEAIKAALL